MGNVGFSCFGASFFSRPLCIEKRSIRVGMEPYTEDKSRIVLSFCNSNGGHYFAHWLRNKLMLELNYFSSRSVYLDNVETRGFGNGQARHHLGTKASREGAEIVGQREGLPVVGPDRRIKSKITGGTHQAIHAGMVPIGAMFKDPEGTPELEQTWLKSWLQAVNEAKVIIQIQSGDYWNSGACAKEVGRINEQIGTRPDLWLFAMRIDGEMVKPPDLASANRGGYKYRAISMQADQNKSMIRPHKRNFEQGNPELSSSDLQRLVTQLKKIGC